MNFAEPEPKLESDYLNGSIISADPFRNLAIPSVYIAAQTLPNTKKYYNIENYCSTTN